MAFHTEFILDSNGHFANEIDPQGQTHNGIINGASLTTPIKIIRGIMNLMLQQLSNMTRFFESIS